MATPLVILVAQACKAAAVIGRGPVGGLTLKAPPTGAALAKQLRERDADVLQLFEWRRAELSEPAPCLLCRTPALLRDPVERRPAHKVCVDAVLRAAQNDSPRSAARTGVRR